MDHCPRRTVLFSCSPRVVAALFCLPITSPGALPAAFAAASPIALP